MHFVFLDLNCIIYIAIAVTTTVSGGSHNHSTHTHPSRKITFRIIYDLNMSNTIYSRILKKLFLNIYFYPVYPYITLTIIYLDCLYT